EACGTDLGSRINFCSNATRTPWPMTHAEAAAARVTPWRGWLANPLQAAMLTNSSPPGRYDEGSAERVCASHVTTVGAAAPLRGTAHAQSCCKTCSKGTACGDSCIAK